MSKTLQSILATTNEFVKSAAAKYDDATKEAMPTETPSSTESLVGEEAKAPHTEVKEIAPDYGTKTTDGSQVDTKDVTDAPNATTGGEDKNTGEAGIHVGGDVTDQANSKTGSAIGQHLLNILSKKTAAAAPAAKVKGAAAAPTGEAAEADATKAAAGGQTIQLDNDLLAKIAEVILTTEEGWEFAEKALTKQAGAEAAKEIIDGMAAQVSTKTAEAQDWDAGYDDANALIKQATQAPAAGEAQIKEAATKTAAADWDAGYADATARITKVAEAQAAQVSTKTAEAQDWDAGYADANALIKQATHAMEEEAALGAEAIPAGEAIAGGDALGAEEAEMAADAMGNEPELSPEEAMEVLAELVESGAIPPELAEEVARYIANMGAGEAAPMGEEMPADAGMDAGLAEEPGMGEDPKMAAAKDLESKVASIVGAVIAKRA